jgi:hypothetical protein
VSHLISGRAAHQNFHTCLTREKKRKKKKRVIALSPDAFQNHEELVSWKKEKKELNVVPRFLWSFF